MVAREPDCSAVARPLVLAAAHSMLTFVDGQLRTADAEGRPLPEGDAYAPWRLWNDPRLRATPLALVAAAVLAANPHDTQPWLFGVRDDAIDVAADLSRNLGAMDAYLREMHLGLGCAIENMAIAAGPNGYRAEVEGVDGSLIDLVARTGQVLAARVRLEKIDARRRPIRSTSRFRRATQTATPTTATSFRRPTGAHSPKAATPGRAVRTILIGEGSERRAFDAAVVDATEAIIADAAMIADSDRWFRGSRAEIEAHRDGPTLDAAGLSFLTLAYARLFPVSPRDKSQRVAEPDA